MRVSLVEELEHHLSTCPEDSSMFESLFLSVLNKHAPIKQKNLRGKNSPFMTKRFRKAIMHRSHLKDLYLKKRNNETWNSYKKTKKLSVPIY